MPSKSSKWINHVLGYKKKHNVSFTEALKNASKTYKKGGDTTSPVKVEDTTPDVKVEDTTPDVKVEDAVKVEEVEDVKVGGNCNMLKGGKKSRKQRRSARRSRRNRKTKTRR